MADSVAVADDVVVDVVACSNRIQAAGDDGLPCVADAFLAQKRQLRPGEAGKAAKHRSDMGQSFHLVHRGIVGRSEPALDVAAAWEAEVVGDAEEPAAAADDDA